MDDKMNGFSIAGETEEPEAWLHKPTGNVFKDGEYQSLIEIWFKQFTNISEAEMKADFIPLYASPPIEPAGVTITDEMVERAARAIASTNYDGIVYTTRSRQNYINAEWRRHQTDARTALTAVLERK